MNHGLYVEVCGPFGELKNIDIQVCVLILFALVWYAMLPLILPLFYMTKERIFLVQCFTNSCSYGMIRDFR